MTEHHIMDQIRIHWTKLGHRLFRINAGQAWVGKALRPTSRITVSVCPRDIVLFDCRPFTASFVGCPDLIGWKKVKITPEMVGQTIAVFAGVEVKGPRGKATAEQLAFNKTVNESGGHGRIARSIEESL